MRRTPKSRKSTKLENSLWHYQKFFRELKQRRIDFMQQKNYRNFHFGNIYSDCFVAVKQQQQSTRNVATRRQVEAQTQTQKYNLKQKQGQVQVAATVGEVNFKYEQQARSLRNTSHSSAGTTTTSTRIDESARTALTKDNGCNNSTTLNSSSVTATTPTPTTTPGASKTDTDTVTLTNATRRRGNTPLKPMPLLAHLLHMSLSLANAAQLLRQV
uniref:Uncharacterized protein n=1 Tax=Bactrocera dorsalis TaxID=27457 RepID=A0A034VP68_BACDO